MSVAYSLFVRHNCIHLLFSDFGNSRAGAMGETVIGRLLLGDCYWETASVGFFLLSTARSVMERACGILAWWTDGGFAKKSALEAAGFTSFQGAAS